MKRLHILFLFVLFAFNGFAYEVETIEQTEDFENSNNIDLKNNLIVVSSEKIDVNFNCHHVINTKQSFFEKERYYETIINYDSKDCLYDFFQPIYGVDENYIKRIKDNQLIIVNIEKEDMDYEIKEIAILRQCNNFDQDCVERINKMHVDSFKRRMDQRLKEKFLEEQILDSPYVDLDRPSVEILGEEASTQEYVGGYDIRTEEYGLPIGPMDEGYIHRTQREEIDEKNIIERFKDIIEEVGRIISDNGKRMISGSYEMASSQDSMQIYDEPSTRPESYEEQVYNVSPLQDSMQIYDDSMIKQEDRSQESYRIQKDEEKSITSLFIKALPFIFAIFVFGFVVYSFVFRPEVFSSFNKKTKEIDITQVYKVLSNPIRLEILVLLNDADRIPTDISIQINKTKPTTIEHLNKMIDVGLIQKITKPGKKFVYYGITPLGRRMLLASAKEV